METYIKIALPIVTLLNFGLIFIWQSLRVYWKTGINPFRFGREDNAHNYVGQIMKISIVLLIISVLLFPFENYYQYLLPFKQFEHDSLKIIALILLPITSVWVLWAQLEMGDSWRIGLDNENQTVLKTYGIFSISRNPIFLGMMVNVAATFLIAPNLATFAVLLISFLSIQIQVRLEEEFLTASHGEVYITYLSRVRRWL